MSHLKGGPLGGSYAPTRTQLAAPSKRLVCIKKLGVASLEMKLMDDGIIMLPKQ